MVGSPPVTTTRSIHFRNFLQPAQDMLEGHVLHRFGAEHQVPVVAERAPEIAAARKEHGGEVRLPVDKACLDEALYGKIRQSGQQ